MSLYPAQQKIADKILNAYRHPNYYLQQRIYLSGEMGVGKTYIASYVISHMLKKHPVILVVPPDIVSKWKTVLSAYAPKANIKVYNNKTCLHNGSLNLKAEDVNLIPNRYFNRLFLYNDADRSHVTDGTDTNPAHAVAMENYDNITDCLGGAEPMLVYDEVHQISKSKQYCFSALLGDTNLFGLFLTGTIFNMSLDSVSRLVEITHPRLYNYVDNVEDGFWDYLEIGKFMFRVWRYISVSISLKQVKSTNKISKVHKVHQKIVPIKTVAIDAEEHAFYMLAYQQLKSLGKSSNKAKLGASNFLYYPQRPPEIRIHRNAGAERLEHDTRAVVAMPLMNIDLKKTKKYQALCKYLNKYGKNKRTLIYVTDHHLIHTLTGCLREDGYKAKHLKRSLDPDQYASYINSSYKNGTSVFIVDPRQVNVGVDIDGDVLIWYQLLLNMTDIIQAQHRIHRLSSKRDSLVIFLAYRLTYQEQLVHQISNAGKDNAASYGVQKHDNLTKLTGVLLQGINN